MNSMVGLTRPSFPLMGKVPTKWADRVRPKGPDLEAPAARTHSVSACARGFGGSTSPIKGEEVEGRE